MRLRLTFILAFVATAFIACNTSSAQTFGGFCTSGLQPDGYIDFSGLPKPPVSTGFTPTPPVTAVLPVKGVPGLTVTVTIPGINVIPAAGPAYSTVGGTLHLNGFPASNESAAPTVLTLQFSQPIQGAGVDISTNGRFTYTYALHVGLPTDEPPIFGTTSNGYFQGIPTPQVQSLQMVGMQGTFQTASIQFQGDPEEYFSVTLSNIRVQSSSAPDPASVVPRSGLQQWLRADSGNIYQPNPIWQDQSGHGHNATASANQPGLVFDGRNCKPSFVFGGSQSFSFNLPIAGWNQMTVFLVAKATTDGTPGAYFSRNSAILWAEDAQWGNTFITPYQTHVYARFGTTQPNNNLSYTRPGGGVGQDFTITRAQHNQGTDSIFVNGVQAFQQTGKLSALGGAGGAGTIGQGVNGTYFTGEISEILVYDRVLSTNEAALVESYLANKYGTH